MPVSVYWQRVHGSRLGPEKDRDVHIVRRCVRRAWFAVVHGRAELTEQHGRAELTEQHGQNTASTVERDPALNR